MSGALLVLLPPMLKDMGFLVNKYVFCSMVTMLVGLNLNATVEDPLIKSKDLLL